MARGLNTGAVVLVNSQSAGYLEFRQSLEPYFIQFGLPYEVRDLSKENWSSGIDAFSLIIIGHRGLDPPHTYITPEDEKKLLSAIETGTGLVSFDGLVGVWSDRRPRALYEFINKIFGFELTRPERATAITIGSTEGVAPEVATSRYITAMGEVPRVVPVKRPITLSGLVPRPPASVLVKAGAQPLLVAATYGQGRALAWTSYEWTKPDVKGKVYGLDDLVWRGLVWAARKPFLLRAVPHYLALRIDDVAGFGRDSNRHLGYVATANRYGLKPWLGVFLDDLREDPEAVRALAQFTQQGLATASVHARRWHDFFYLDEPLWNDERGANIAGHGWPAEKVNADFAEAEKYFDEHGIVKSMCVLPHFYEFGGNVFEGLKRWGAEFASTVITPGEGYGSTMLSAGPYLSGEPLRASNSSDPVFIADWLAVPGHPEFDHQFFNFVEEVRDVTGYEWAPSGVPIGEAARRGVVESRREFDSLLPAVLFTHESDHIQHLTPAEWDRILQGVMDGLRAYQPIPVTLDFLSQYMRALRTSAIKAARCEPTKREGSIELQGLADLPTRFCVFEDSTTGVVARECEIPPFEGRIVVKWKADQHEPSGCTASVEGGKPE